MIVNPNSENNPFLDDEIDSRDYEKEAKKSFNRIAKMIMAVNAEETARANENAARANENAARANETAARNREETARANETAARNREETARANETAARLEKEIDEALMKFYTDIYLRDPSKANKEKFIQLARDGLSK